MLALWRQWLQPNEFLQVIIATWRVWTCWEGFLRKREQTWYKKISRLRLGDGSRCRKMSREETKALWLGLRIESSGLSQSVLIATSLHFKRISGEEEALKHMPGKCKKNGLTSDFLSCNHPASHASKVCLLFSTIQPMFYSLRHNLGKMQNQISGNQTVALLGGSRSSTKGSETNVRSQRTLPCFLKFPATEEVWLKTKCTHGETEGTLQMKATSREVKIKVKQSSKGSSVIRCIRIVCVMI